MPDIPADDSMIRHRRSNPGPYQPTWSDQQLEFESGDPAASLVNLRRILAAGRRIASLWACEDCILFGFAGGEHYLARGLSLRNHPGDPEKLDALVTLLYEAGLGVPETIRQHLRSFGPDYIGPLSFPPGAAPRR